MRVLARVVLALLPAIASAQTPFIPLNGQIWDGHGGPLQTNVVYHVISNGSSCGISVPVGQTLTIQHGAIVKIGGCVGITGAVVAQGTAVDPIVFTSVHDDTWGGDSNQNGNATVPQRGDWNAWDFTGGGSTFDHCLFRYGGPTGGTVLFLRTNQVTLRNCVMELGAGGAMVEASTATVQDCEFRDFADLPVRGLSRISLPLFTNNRALRCAAGDYALVQYMGLLTGNLAIDRSHSMNGNGVFVFDLPGPQTLHVPAGLQFTIGLGCVIKFVRGGIQSSGRIVAQGIQPPLQVVFTSLKDDLFGGDTNKDGNATQPARGDWQGIDLQAGDTSTFDWTVIHYGGGTGGSGVGLRIDGSSAVLQTCLVWDCAGHGVSFGAPAVPPPSLRDTTILGCAGYGVLGIRWEALVASHDTACAGNGFDHFQVQGSTVVQPLVVRRDSFPGDVLELSGPTTVDAGGVLELPAGTVLKFATPSGFLTRNGGVLRLRGTARRPIVITSIHDDAVGGDTNRNGSVTVPAPGQWNNVSLDQAGVSRLENVLLRHANAPALSASIALHELLRVRAERCNGGFLIAAAGVADDLVAWNCNGDGIQIGGGSFTLRHATAANNGGAGIRRTAAWTGLVRNSIAWGNTGGNFANLVTAQVFHSDGGFPGVNGCVNVDPQFVAAATGDLQLGPGSPCLGTADLTTALAVGRDAAELPRALDHALAGTALPDMGAYERGVWRLTVTGEPRLNQGPMTFAVDGPPAFAIVALGLDDGPPVWLPPYGSLLTGATSVLLGAVPVGQPVSQSLAGSAALLGLRFAVQGMGLGGPAGVMTGVDRNEIRR